MDKAEAIAILKHLIKIHRELKTVDKEAGGLLGEEYINKRIEALHIAIHSLEVDEKYGLLYIETTPKEAADGEEEISNGR